ncbi:MAG: hypothetical protein KGN97_04505 [Bacteroidota bacterium]|jgi:hypothetical protein|nr:hypothetical protein [Bacteroidota bacterium]
MKKHVFISLLVILFASCNTTTPQKSAEKFLTGLINNDSSAMLSSATDQTKELVRFYFMIRLDSIQFDKKISVSPNLISQKKDTAIVGYRLQDQEKELPLMLIKEHGDWKVACAKLDFNDLKNQLDPKNNPALLDTLSN